MAQDRVCAHSVDRRVGRDERPGDGSRPPEHALGLDIHPVPSGGLARAAGTAIAASCQLRQPLQAGFATAARLRTQGRKRDSELSGHAHAAKELLLHRQRFEQDHWGYLRLHAGA